MRRIPQMVIFSGILIFAGLFTGVGGSRSTTGQASASSKALNPCAPPNHMLSSPDKTAWGLLIAATCPVNNNQYPYVTWENWIEQNQMYPPDPDNGLTIPSSLAVANGTTHALHGSPLALLKSASLATTVKGLLGAADQDCNIAADPPNGESTLVICEEVRENGATQDYIAGDGLWNRSGQIPAAASESGIEFPGPAIELKVDWIELASLGYDCNNLPSSLQTGIHIETINGNCYALAGIGLMSKLLNNWIWATWEPQNSITNPNRCQVLGCSDDFGSNPLRTHGANTNLTPQLIALMDSANLAPEWRNYRLDGVQVRFVDADGKPTLLGNSITEAENAGIPLKQSSCISCHAVSSIENDSTDGITLLNSNPVGKPQLLPSRAWSRRDFVWSLSEACPGSPFQNCD